MEVFCSQGDVLEEVEPGWSWVTGAWEVSVLIPGTHLFLLLPGYHDMSPLPRPFSYAAGAMKPTDHRPILRAKMHLACELQLTGVCPCDRCVPLW